MSPLRTFQSFHLPPHRVFGVVVLLNAVHMLTAPTLNKGAIERRDPRGETTAGCQGTTSVWWLCGHHLWGIVACFPPPPLLLGTLSGKSGWLPSQATAAVLCCGAARGFQCAMVATDP